VDYSPNLNHELNFFQLNSEYSTGLCSVLNTILSLISERNLAMSFDDDNEPSAIVIDVGVRLLLFLILFVIIYNERIIC
jgi:hypothetical protein